MRLAKALRTAVFILAMALAGCGGRTTFSGAIPAPSPSPGPSPTPASAIPVVSHVALVVLENHGASQVIGSPFMPFLNSLAAQNSVAMNYFADAHDSIGNYFMLTTGQLESTDDHFSGTINDDNIVRALTGAGKSWKAYMESLPAQGYTGNDVPPYVKQHNPFVFLSDVLSSSAQANQIVPLTQLSADLAASALPSFSFIVPNLDDDAHDCPGGGLNCQDSDKLAAADAWLQANIQPLISSAAFANSVLIITWDEGAATDVAHGGGQVATVVLGAHVRRQFQSVTFFQHQSTLGLILDLLGVADHPGLSASAPSMIEFFQ
jgi:phosphatidylinositol-3-phosphatase